MNISIQMIQLLLGAKFMGTKKLIVCNLLSFSLKHKNHSLPFVSVWMKFGYYKKSFWKQKIISLFGSPCFIRCDDFKKQSVL